jgi:hypothetical protein
MKHYIAIIAILFIFIAGVTMEAQETNKPVKGLKVTFLIYSGRPNPTLTITDEKLIDKIESFIKYTPKNENFKGETVSPSILGYKGILVENFSDSMPDTESLLVFHSNVELKSKTLLGSSATKEIIDDATVELQEMLVQEAQAHGVIDQKEVDLIHQK